MFCVKWSRSRNGAMPIHCIPSPPIWDRPVTVPACASSISRTRAWQPMPAPTSVPGSGLVELVCGKPEQKYGTRLTSESITWLGSPGSGVRGRGDAAGGHPAPQRAEDHVGVQLAVARDELRAVSVALAGDGRLGRAAVEHVADGGLEEGALLLDDQDLLQPVGELADGVLLERPRHGDAQQADTAARQAVLRDA